MARTLRLARALVAPAERSAYRAAVARWAVERAAQGEHLWLFESRSTPGLFLECHERDAAAPEDQASWARLAELAQYQAGSTDQWDEVRLTSDRKE